MLRQRRHICRLAHPVADFVPNLISTIFFGLGKPKKLTSINLAVACL